MPSPTTPTLHKVKVRPTTSDPEVVLLRDLLVQRHVDMDAQVAEYLDNIEARLTIGENAIRDMEEIAFTALQQMGASTAAERAEHLPR